jgi:succinate dehydrogenase/fumarate reductase-like Fe-S protein
MSAPRIATARGATVRFTFDGQALEGHAGESLLAALMAAGIRRLGRGLAGDPRGGFCAMGICQDCVVLVGGEPVEACRARLHEGLVAERLA